jgi:FHA domain/zinc-ribbon domain
MVRCSRCGTSNEPGARFCGGCGAPLSESVASGPPQVAGSGAYPAAPAAPGSAAHPHPAQGQLPPGQLPLGQAPLGAPPGMQALSHPQQPPPGAYGAPAAAWGAPAHEPWQDVPFDPRPVDGTPAPPPPAAGGLPAWPGSPQGAGHGYPGAAHPGVAPGAHQAGHVAHPGNLSPYPGNPALGGYELAGAPAQGVAAVQALAYAETSPPLYDEHALSRPLPDRGRRRVLPDDRGTDVPPPQALRAPEQPVAAFDPMSVPRDAPRVLSGILVSFESNPLGQFWPLFQGPNLVGRLGAGVGADIELPHATVSSRHALLSAAAHPGRIVIADQGSTNGTFVNETPLAQDQPRELRDGDRVRLGLYSLLIKIL